MSSDVSAEFLALQSVLAGRYSLERELGRGGMGIVLLARDVALDRLVAIKLLPAELAADTEHRERFLREARTAAGLSHPNIVPIHTVEEHGDLVFFVMGFVEGESLRDRVLRTGPLSPRAAMKIMQEVAWALGYAHERGVIHRDIKPDNIMLDRSTDRALVTDFGIARVVSQDEDAPNTEVVGTARYMSPEQACGEPVAATSDLYSLGATFFFALTGRAPFDGKNLPAIMMKHVTEPAPAIGEVRQEVPARLAEVIDRCLEKDPSRRVQMGEDVARSLSEARGRDFRAPPLVRGFMRNAEVTTMVFFAAMVAGGGVVVTDAGVEIIGGGPGVVGVILLVQLVAVARRLLREGYAFPDIRAALLAEAEIQQEEAELIIKRRWLRRMGSMWHRLWAGRFGRFFFRTAGIGIRPPDRPAVPSADATEMVLTRSVLETFQALPAGARAQLRDVPEVVRRLEGRAERLRARGARGDELTEAVAALENVRIALLKLDAGTGTSEQLTRVLERARAVGFQVDGVLAARAEVAER